MAVQMGVDEPASVRYTQMTLSKYILHDLHIFQDYAYT